MNRQELYEEQEFEGAIIIRLRKSNDIAGMVLETKYHDGRSCFTVYGPTGSGFQWINQSADRAAELSLLRSLLYADCAYCAEWPCLCTPEELCDYEAEHQRWIAEIARNTGMMI